MIHERLHFHIEGKYSPKSTQVKEFNTKTSFLLESKLTWINTVGLFSFKCICLINYAANIRDPSYSKRGTEEVSRNNIPDQEFNHAHKGSIHDPWNFITAVPKVRMVLNVE